MTRFVLHLVLILSFLSNGLADARGHRDHSGQKPDCVHRVDGTSPKAMVHAHHDGSAAAQPGDQVPAQNGTCCGDAVCKCACARVPAVFLSPSIYIAPQIALTIPPTAEAQAAIYGRSSAPFRPPSI